MHPTPEAGTHQSKHVRCESPFPAFSFARRSPVNFYILPRQVHLFFGSTVAMLAF